MQTRTNAVSGFSNLFFTMVYGLFFDDVKSYVSFLPLPEAPQKIRVSGKALYNMLSTGSKIECFSFGKEFGTFISEVLEAKTDSFIPLIEALTKN